MNLACGGSACPQDVAAFTALVGSLPFLRLGLTWLRSKFGRNSAKAPVTAGDRVIYANVCLPSQVEQEELYKYIRLSTGEIRLAKLFAFGGPDHINLVDDEKSETVVSAGTIRIGSRRKFWNYCTGGYGSSTCNVGWLEDDTALLSEALGLPQE